MRIARWTFAVLLTAPLAALSIAPFVAGPALAQDQDNSLAAAARRAQEQKKDQPKAAKVYNNDNLPTTGLNVVGQQPAATDGTASTTTDASSTSAPAADAKPAPTAAELAGMNADLSSAKQRLADLKADLDIAQRKYTLDQATYYGKPNFAADKASAAALDSEKSNIDSIAAAVADAEKAVAAAQAKVDAGSQAATAAASQEKAAQGSSNSSTQPATAPQDNSAPTKTPPSTPNPDTVTVNPQ